MVAIYKGSGVIISNEYSKVTQAAFVRDVVQETALLEYLNIIIIFYMLFCTYLKTGKFWK